MTFVEYVGFYGLARSEGLVLRYLADAYRALRRTVPDAARNEELEDLIEWLGELTRQVDSSLLDEWEELAAGDDLTAADLVRPPLDTEIRPVTGNPRAFRVLVRNAMFRRVELAARRDWGALGELDGEAGWAADDWRDGLAPYWDEHDVLLTDADARGPHLLVVDARPRRARRLAGAPDPARPGGRSTTGARSRRRPRGVRRGGLRRRAPRRDHRGLTGCAWPPSTSCTVAPSRTTRWTRSGSPRRSRAWTPTCSHSKRSTVAKSARTAST